MQIKHGYAPCLPHPYNPAYAAHTIPHAERGLDRRLSPPLRCMERGPGGEVNQRRIRTNLLKCINTRPYNTTAQYTPSRRPCLPRLAGA